MIGAVLFALLAVLELANPVFGAVNIARVGVAKQSSLYENGFPERAIDGNRASDWGRGSCSHTLNDLGAWWRLDLLESYKITKITITNRGDAVPQRINGSEIRIGDSLDDNGNANPRCAVISTIPAGGSKPFLCNGMEGRYINIVIPERQEYLTLCEVEVYGVPSNITIPGANIARLGTVQQSSVFEVGDPVQAVDGDRDSIWSHGSCSHTRDDTKPWWRLDLPTSYRINKVVITNRGDCCPERIDGAEIRIGDSLEDNGNSNPRCTVITTIPSGVSESFICNGMEGRYINIVIPERQEYLTLCEVEVYGVPLDGTIPAVNVARTGTVQQSSVFEVGDPEKAVDGNRDSTWSHGSCSHTRDDIKPWWRLDLDTSYRINKVVITNRGDCCPERINGAEIRIGDSLERDGNYNPRCTVITTIPQGVSESFYCNGMEGRYVNIVIPERQEYLTLCEVEVYGEPSNITIPVVNVARSGTVQQSSLFEVGDPEKAVDGNRDGTWSHGFCSHTRADYKPWWRLDLLTSYRINKVVITNREDCCPERINGAEIRIGNSLEHNGNSNPRCTVITTIPPGVSESFFCYGMEGRYVNIVIPGRQEYLTLCEVEVYGVPLDGTFPADTNVARGGTVAQSTVFEGAVPERAIDGNRDSTWSHGSCSHTVNDIKPWWRLDLLKTYTINKVIITNREDAVPERINGAEIRIGDTLEDNGNSNPVCTVISSIRAGASQTFLCSGMEGRYINIVIPGRQEYLTLCEVEVYGAPSDGTSPIANVARAGTAAQSSVFEHGLPENAIDGNLNSIWAKRSCSHTRNDTKPWWRVDLLSSKRINKVVITNRIDCCSQRINGAEIRIGDSLGDNGNDNPRCTVITGIPAGRSQTFYCNGMDGRYVNIVIPNRQEYLTLCEVEVYGEEIPEV